MVHDVPSIRDVYGNFVNLEDLSGQSLRLSFRIGLCACIYRGECVCILCEYLRP
jgi:hypothetical protein